MIDASLLNTIQIQYLAQNEQQMFVKLDFTRCNDKLINTAIGNSPGNNVSIPLKYRRTAKLVKEFLWLSKEARRLLCMEEEECLLTFQNKNLSQRCLYLVRSMMGMGLNVKWGNKEEEGYNSLIRSCIYNKGQLLKDNQHEEYGLLLSGQTEFILREVYSGPIQKRSVDIPQYTCYTGFFCTTRWRNDM